MSKDLDEFTLYVRGQNKQVAEMDDVWDDTVLNNAYDKALKMANEEVAKRIAMETNSNQTVGNKPGNEKGIQKPKKTAKSTPSTSKKVTEWKGGMPCRAIYEEDGFEYEAFVVKILNDNDCIVRFLGYDNSEQVPISSLKPTMGDEARMRQLEAALGERADDGFESQPSESADLYSDDATTSPERPNQKKRSTNRKKKNSAGSENGDLPPLPLPTMNMFRNMSANEMPLPPPPPLVSLSERSDAEEQAISDMLLSWYMTGYYTGLYQGMKRQRQGRRYR